MVKKFNIDFFLANFSLTNSISKSPIVKAAWSNFPVAKLDNLVSLLFLMLG